MILKELLADIEKLRGLELESIRKGSEIRIDEVDWKRQRVIVHSLANDTIKSRPFDEFDKILVALNTQTAVHVDSALRGSGSSRNQPETILANLPYVEWFYYKKRKHLILLESSSHDYGELKKVGPIKASQLVDKLTSEELLPSSTDPTQVVVISGEVAAHAETLAQISGIPAKSLGQGVYEYSMPTSKVLLISNTSLSDDIKPGTYLVLDREPKQITGTKIQIAQDYYSVYEHGGLCAMYKYGN
ncbi:hypothetical protein [Maridesulfovibrio sp.]|uniref:hypothetical protein n=1 Tax=Maridesulfovibrio sp. TaxID=2795000 RepID=UPI003B00893B